MDEEIHQSEAIATTNRVPTLEDLRDKRYFCVSAEGDNEGDICVLKIGNMQGYSHVDRLMIQTQSGLDLFVSSWNTSEKREIINSTPPKISAIEEGFSVTLADGKVLKFRSIDVEAENSRFPAVPENFDRGAKVFFVRQGTDKKREASQDAIILAEKIRWGGSVDDVNPHSRHHRSSPIVSIHLVDEREIVVTTLSGAEYHLKLLAAPPATTKISKYLNETLQFVMDRLHITGTT